MDIEKLSDFLENCCRVCLAIENEMVDSANIVENFNKTIDQLLFECADMKMLNKDDSPKLVCEECTGELVMVAKFREKCAMSSAALTQLTKQINKKSTAVVRITDTLEVMREDAPEMNKGSSKDAAEIKTEHSNADNSREQIENDDCNIEYVIFDPTHDFEENDEIADETITTADAKDRDETTTLGEGLTKRMRRKKKYSSKNDSFIQHHCKVCGAGFAQLKNLTRHLLTHNDVDVNKMNQFVCGTCGDVFADEIDCVEHQKSHELEKSTKTIIEDQSMSITPNDSTSKRSQKKTHVCEFCERAFPSISLLTTHIRIHTNERPFGCKTCPKTFKTQGALDLHTRRHDNVKPYQCTVCNRGFVESSNLKVHMRTHTGEKPHKCLSCGRQFSRVFLLQIHQRTHTGEKPYGCPVCKKSFAQQGDLAAHKRIHSGERPHTCKICKKGFIKSSGLTQHMRRHSKTTVSKKLKGAPADSGSNEESEQIEFLNLGKDEDTTKNEQVLICYKEYNDNDNDHVDNFSEYF